MSSFALSFFIMKKIKLLFYLIACILLITSCAAPKYMGAPKINYPYVKNTYHLGIQNMDKEANIDTKNVICRYKNFDIKYKITNNYIVTFEITNKSEKSMIIDKSKSYVLYDGYATELFKDVRSSRSTTFNNVQDAINNVQTNEAGVSMTIPPYSKWTVALKESNLKKMEKLPKFKDAAGVTNLSQFDEIDITEFVIPYSFDYSMAKWSTCRNRVFINTIISEKTTIPGSYLTKHPLDCVTRFDEDGRFYYTYRIDYTIPIDYSEANKIDDINMEMYKKHRRKVNISHICWSPVTVPLLIAGYPLYFIPSLINESCNPWGLYGCKHHPTVYGNKYIQKEYGRPEINSNYDGK